MKFTEEQYQKIVEIVNKYPDFWAEYIVPNGGEGQRSTTLKELILGVFGSRYNIENRLYMVRCMLALANPLTRELAHEQYVEKEKKYVWSSKRIDRDSNVLTLYIDEYGMVSTSYRKVYENNLRNEDMLITESEIKAWGYNPEMFDKEEVD